MRANGDSNGHTPVHEPAPNPAGHPNGSRDALHKRADWRGQRVLLSGRVPPSVREYATQLAKRRGVSVGDLLADLLTDGAAEVLDPLADSLDPLPPGPFKTILADPP